MDRDILHKKLRRIRGISIELEDACPELSEKLMDAYTLLVDASTNLDLVPRDLLIEEATQLNRSQSLTTGKSRSIFQQMVRDRIKEDKDLIKRKLRNLSDDEEALIRVASSLAVMRKVMSGISAELSIEG
jgi:hypothetical protein